ncbi:MAG TPA: acyl-CoA dehydrogenase C-terminal domain-containing protein, partial [Halomonas sp.]|nr:acyl-CoA dehydrogenase C-terminal domain-containing protein [Halomonas sp.]
ALDLAGRKLSQDGGAALAALIDEVEATAAALGERESLAPLGESLAGGAADLRAAMGSVLAQSCDPDTGSDAVQALATPFLSLAGHVLCAWQMGLAALKADAALAAGSDDDFYRTKLAGADFALRHWLPLGRAQRAVIDAGMENLLALNPAAL